MLSSAPSPIPFQVWNLTLTMLSDKYLKAKAAETHGLLDFAVQMLVKHQQVLVANDGDQQGALLYDLLTHAGQSAQSFDSVLAANSRVLSEEACEQLMMHYNRFIVLCDRAGVDILPKAHLMYHCIQRSLRKGNPRTYSTYVDESYNGAIARVCRSVHRRGWALAVYRKVQMLEAFATKKKEN